ncbi:MAG TPA: type IX secretion system sortase PorU [Flavipsychrobacter sp.]|nr:type IX secretion system sortase PorU [Flavipsychrobacter sp.]
MKKAVLAITLFAAFIATEVRAEKLDFSVTKGEISNGYVVKKIWLQNYAMPKVALQAVGYTDAEQIPADAYPCKADNFDIVLGKDRKRPFALVRVPAYIGTAGAIKRISSFSIDITEAETTGSAVLKTTAASTPLATGNWYKIAVPETGVYKVDYDFIVSKLGVDASKISPSNIRVFGNGGNMLPENNAIPRKTDLTEVAIWVNDGGDGVFGQGDYVVFYAVGPTKWALNTDGKTFSHAKNLYEDKAYYFLNFDATGKRLAVQQGSLSANVNSTSYNDYYVYENDLNNPAKYGKNWVGEDFSTLAGKTDNRTIEFDLGTLNDTASFRIVLASRGDASPNNFTITRNGLSVGTYQLGSSAWNDDAPPMTTKQVQWLEANASGKNTLKFNFVPARTDITGYLDYVEVNTRKALAYNGSAFVFRDAYTTGAGKITSYRISNADANLQVWDVTDANNVVKMNGTLAGNEYQFVQDAATLHQFAVINGGNAGVPEYVGKVDNQNLHAHDAVDYVIVAAPEFVPAAEELADFHRQQNKYRVLVTTPQHIYNEFSSGSQDISAIRDFVKMFYDRAGNDVNEMPKYLLLLGDASYDYKNRISNNTNFVPTFESEQSFDRIASYSGDDFFGFLDDNEDIENTNIANTLDIGVGRFPVKTLEEARWMVNKVKVYKSPSSLGPWRISTTLVTDDEDNAGPHMEDGEIMDTTITYRSNLYNSSKIYLDAVPFVSTPGGARAPQANKSINDQIFKGTLLLNYNGHGNIDVLAHERIITQDDYSKWANLNKLPFMITATCDFGQFDQPQFVSAGEQIVLKKDGGAIASLTTTQLVYQDPNRIINKDFLDAQFDRENGNWHTFGDAMRIGKNKTYSVAGTSSSYIVNFRKFALLGDPALTPNFPEQYIYTESIKDGITGQPVNTLSALGSYTVDGYVGDENKQILNSFNGRVTLIIYDKPRTVKTITPINKTFKVRNNIIYRGKATVTNGKFSVSFIAPKDINYEVGKGKISYYAENGLIDGAGFDTTYKIGGYSDNPILEKTPPIVRPYIGDSMFVNGGLTGSNSLLFVVLQDETGINVSGNAVGHDLVGILDDNVESPFILNDYYETEANTYKKGYVNFPMTGLANGRHRLKVKAWDVNNNSGEGTVDFEVADGKLVKMQRLSNYPNPFKDKTHFVFEHNHPDEYLYSEIYIYTMDGRLVRTLKQVYEAGAGASRELVWDGTDASGATLPSGVYLYKLQIVAENGAKDIAYQKLVIAR